MKAEQPKKSKNKDKAALTRKGIVLITVLAVLILVVNIVTASFSWFTPASVEGAGMEYVATTFNRSERCSFSTARGKKLGAVEGGKYIDEIIYDSDGKNLSNADWEGNNIWTDSDGKVTKVTIPAGGIMYFETTIANEDTKYPSDVSIYFASFGSASSNLSVAVTYPSNTVRKVTSIQTDFCLLRNAYVKLKDEADVDGPGLLKVEWFVKNNGTSDETIKLAPESAGGDNANVYLMYN